MTTSYTFLKTSLLGELLLVANKTQLTGIYFADRGHTPAIRRDWVRNAGHPVLKKTARELEDYLAGKRQTFSVSIQGHGTSFQRKVWKQIGKIPFGQTVTYSELARRAGSPRAVRAAGTATGSNPLGIVIPCHRVIGKDGALRGYAGGLERKRRLIELESADARN